MLPGPGEAPAGNIAGHGSARQPRKPVAWVARGVRWSPRSPDRSPRWRLAFRHYASISRLFLPPALLSRRRCTGRHFKSRVFPAARDFACKPDRKRSEDGDEGCHLAFGGFPGWTACLRRAESIMRDFFPHSGRQVQGAAMRSSIWRERSTNKPDHAGERPYRFGLPIKAAAGHRT